MQSDCRLKIYRLWFIYCPIPRPIPIQCVQIENQWKFVSVRCKHFQTLSSNTVHFGVGISLGLGGRVGQCKRPWLRLIALPKTNGFLVLLFPSRNYRDVSGTRVTTLRTMRRKLPACVRRDRSALTGEPQRSVSPALPPSQSHLFCRLSLFNLWWKGASFRGKWCSHTKAWKYAFTLRRELSLVKASALRA